MKALGDIVQATKLPEVLRKAQPHGLTTTGGSLTICREAPLTENQITEIASQMLRGAFLIKSEPKKIYGKKTIKDEFGEYAVENEIIGEKSETCLDVWLNNECSVSILNAALALSPKQATLKHLTRLAIHKKIGSNDSDRKIILHDYVSALSDFPEFVLFSVCKNYWENDRRPFLPFIDEIKDACTLFIKEIERLKNNIRNKKNEEPEIPTKKIAAPIPRHDKPKASWNEQDWNDYIEDALGMVELAKKNPTVIDVAGWEDEAKRRQQERKEYQC